MWLGDKYVAPLHPPHPYHKGLYISHSHFFRYCDRTCQVLSCGYDAGDCGMDKVFNNLNGTNIKETDKEILIKNVCHWHCSILPICPICPILLCPILLCPILLCPILLCPILLCPILLCPILLCSILLCPILLCPILLCSILLCSYHEVILPLLIMSFLFLVMLSFITFNLLD
jgi:hypothetical protein